MADTSFFEEQKEQSLVKSVIVAKYFDVWAKIIINLQKRYSKYDQKIAYIDLFAGPGQYKDGTPSTPQVILKIALDNQSFRERLITIFNDKDVNNARELEKTISAIPQIETLKYQPVVYNREVDEKIPQMFKSVKSIPTLLFVDPWGYKGLSLQLFNSFLKGWGCDVIFFFNYNRINMGLNNEYVEKHMNALFGEERAANLREKVMGENSDQREFYIIEELCQSFNDSGSRYVLPFRFKNSQGNRTSHHLIFLSDNFRGYEIMKEIMAKESSSNTQGVPSFEYNPTDFLPKQALLFQLSRPLEDLKIIC